MPSNNDIKDQSVVEAIKACLETRNRSSSRVSSLEFVFNILPPSRPSVQCPVRPLFSPSSCHLVFDRNSCGPRPPITCSRPLPFLSRLPQPPTRSSGRFFSPSTACSSSLLKPQRWGRAWRWWTPQRWSACCGTGHWAILGPLFSESRLSMKLGSPLV